MGEYRPEVLTVRTDRERRKVRTKKRPSTDILPVWSRASLVNKEGYTTEGYTTEESKVCKDTSAESFGTMPGPILRIYWTGNRAF